LKLRGAAYILWRYRGEWDGAWISGSGPLGEAYVAFFLNNYKFNSAIEASVRTFMTNKRYGAINADSASGFLKGDVVKGAAQFGVKTLGAQTMSYLEVIEYAKEILQTVDIIYFPQHCLYFLPEPHGQSSFLPTFLPAFAGSFLIGVSLTF
jgi:hypothetical protein